MEGGAGDARLPSLPALEEPLGLPRPMAEPEPPEAPQSLDSPVAVFGERAEIRGTGRGIDAVWIHPVRIHWEGPEDRRDTVTAVRETPAGVERRVRWGAVDVAERWVAARDAPVAWVEWTVAEDGREPDTTGTDDLTLAWRVDFPEDSGEARWEPHPRGGLLSLGGARLVFAFNRTPTAVDIQTADRPGEARASVRISIPSTGLRVALVAVGPDGDLDRALRVAGRTRVATGAREGAVDRLLQEGLSVSTTDPAVAHRFDRHRARLAFRPTTPRGQWRVQDAIGAAADRVVLGAFPQVLETLTSLAGGALDPAYRAPALGLLTEYLAWSGDRAGVGQLWAWALDTAASCAADSPLPDGLAAALVQAAEELGEPGSALSALPVGDAAGSEPPRGLARVEGPGHALSPIREMVYAVLGAEPDAPRSRLVLRPRLPGTWGTLGVRGLRVGEAGMDMDYRRTGSVHQWSVRPTRGAAPVQVVLAPEVVGGGVAGVRMDGEPAELDVEPTTAPAPGRWRVPVQMVLDRPRTLEVELRPDFV